MRHERTPDSHRGWPLIVAGLALAMLAWFGQPWWNAGAAAPSISRLEIQSASLDGTHGDSELAAWGRKHIEDVEPGDRVLTRDPQTHELYYRRVLRVFQRTSDHLRVLEVRDPTGGATQVFETTDEHPFWVAGTGFVEAGRLQIGDRLESPDGSLQIVDRSERRETPAGIPVYNLEVEDSHTYFVQAHGSRAPPIFVHNTDCGGGHFSGTDKPWTSGATPNSKYTHIGPDGKAVQNAIYDANGNVVGHVDFKNHGPGAESGHGHQFPVPGDPSSGHGPGKPHIPNNQLPPGWSDLPSGVSPRTPIGQ